MRILSLALAISLCLAGVLPAVAKEKKKSDTDKIQGTWQTVKAELSGVTLPDDLVGTLKFVIKGDKILVMGVPQIVGQYGEATFKLDSSTKPKIIDFKVGAGEKKGDEVEGIYELTGENELKFCAKLVGKDRPGEFSTKEGDNRVVIFLKREKK